MKKQLTAYMIALMAATGCGSLAQLASAPQAFDDGIYTKPQTQAALAATSQEEMDALVRETLSSEVYVLSAQGDTIVVPKGKSARLSSGPDGGTDIAVFDTPDYWWNYSWSFRPWYLGGWYSPWYTSSWAFRDPWFWDPWYYGYGFYPYRPYY